MKSTRTEVDSMGAVEVPLEALYGAQTQRAVENFPISGQSMPVPFLRALIQIKRAAAMANVRLNELGEAKASAIVQACDQLLALDAVELISHFPVDIYQTGSGTSSNMNANEVIATLASENLGHSVHPNDDVNRGQSSNDVIPTAIHVSAAQLLDSELLPALVRLEAVIRTKANTLTKVIKTGRTHLMDAMPVRMSQSLEAWADQVALSVRQLRHLQPELQHLAQGGTAVGTGVNAHPDFARVFCQELNQITGHSFAPAERFFSLIATQDTVVSLSGQLKTCAVSFMKIANDLRWMNSGPLAGLGEIELEAMQPGSSIMPGKVNPVIPEATCMAAAQVIGLDTAISIGGQSGSFELNVMLPMIANNILTSLTLLSATARLLADKAIVGFKVNQTNLNKALSRNPILVTALNPIIGYQEAARIAKLAYQQGRPIVDVAVEETDLSRKELEQLLDPAVLTGSQSR